MKKYFSLVALVMFLMGVYIVPTMAADYPTKPIIMINPQAPGGTNDIVGRAFASVAEKFLGKPIIVVNKTGANGMIGRTSVLQAPPDGYTICLDTSNGLLTFLQETISGRKPPYDHNDFIFIGSFDLNPALVVVPYNSPWKTLDDLIKACKAKPRFYALGSGSLATYVPAEVLMKATGITARHVPFKGGGPCMVALIGGHVDFATQWPPTSIPYAEGKKIRILAAQSDKRFKFSPNTPTVRELGIDAEWQQWVGLTASKNIPSPVVEKLREVAKRVSEDESFIRTIEKSGDEARFMSGDELTKFSEMEKVKFSRIMKQLVEEDKIAK